MNFTAAMAMTATRTAPATTRPSAFISERAVVTSAGTAAEAEPAAAVTAAATATARARTVRRIERSNILRLPQGYGDGSHPIDRQGGLSVGIRQQGQVIDSGQP